MPFILNISRWQRRLANRVFGTNCETPLSETDPRSIKHFFRYVQIFSQIPRLILQTFFRGLDKCLQRLRTRKSMICVGREVLLGACNPVKNGSLGARRGLSAFVREPVRVGLNGRAGLPPTIVRGLFSKPPTGTQGLPKNVKQQNRTTLVSLQITSPPSNFPQSTAVPGICSYWHNRLVICSCAPLQVSFLTFQ